MDNGSRLLGSSENPEAAHTPFVWRASAELVSAEPTILHYDVMSYLCARPFTSDWPASCYPMAGCHSRAPSTQEAGLSLANGRSVESGALDVVQNPLLHRDELGGGRRRTVISRTFGAVRSLRFSSLAYAMASVTTLAALAAGCSRHREDQAWLTVTVRKANFRRVIQAKGILEPLKETTVKSPLSRRLARIVQDGTIVEEGDVLFELDPEGLEQKIRRYVNSLEVAKAGYESQKATAARRMHYADDRVASAELTLEVKRGELANAKAGLLTPESTKIIANSDLKRGKVDVDDAEKRLTMAKKLRTAGVEGEQQLEHQVVAKKIAELKEEKADVTVKEIDEGPTYDEIRQFELELELAEFQLQQARKYVERTSERNERYLRYYQSIIERNEGYLKRAQDELAECIVRSPVPGMVLAKVQRGRKVIPGMSVYRNWDIVSLPDLSKMQVLTMVEESRISEVRIGQPARVAPVGVRPEWLRAKVVKVDSLPREVYNGLTSDKRHWVSRPERRVFEVHLEVLEKDDRLKPGMRADIELEVASQPDGLVIPTNALTKQGERWLVHRLRADGSLLTPIQLGARNEYEASVTAGLDAGDRILLRCE